MSTILYKEKRVGYFTWVKSIKDYKLNSRNISKSHIPLIKPLDPGIESEWKNILRWYGLEEVHNQKVFKGASSQSTIVDKVNIIICIGTKYVPACSVFCNLTGRLLLRPNNFKAINFLNINEFESILFVGEEKYFHRGFLDQISKKITIPWGFISGKDELDICFFFAKILATGRCRSKQNLLIDAPSRNIIIQKNKLPGSAFSFNKKTLDILLKKEWRNLTILAHGEISHVLLNSWVICGKNAQLDIPLTKDIEFCNETSSGRTCIRVHSKHISILYISELKTNNLLLFSCTSLSFSSKLTPPNASIFYSVVSGYCSSAILTNRNVIIDEEIVMLSYALCCKRIPQGFIVNFLNDYEEHKHKDRPYILVGDPSIVNNEQKISKFQIKKKIIRGDQQLQMFLLSNECIDRIINVKGYEKINQGKGDFLIVRGIKYLTIYLKRKCNKRFEFEFKGHEYNSIKHLFRSSVISYQSFKFLEETLTKFIDSHPKIKDFCSETCILLSFYSNKIKEIIDDGVVLIDNIKKQGLWNEAILKHQGLLKDHLRNWQSNFCNLLTEPILFSYFGNLLSENMVRKLLHKQSLCDYCGGVEKTYRMSHPRANIKSEAILCDWCGLKQISIPDTGPFEIIHSKKLIPTTTLPVKIKFHGPSENKRNEEGVSMHLVVSLYNKSQEKEIYHNYISTTKRECNVFIDIPHKITSDLHIVRVVCLSSPYIQYYRSRISAND